MSGITSDQHTPYATSKKETWCQRNMGLDPQTAIRWTTPEQALGRVQTRNKRLRIVNESLMVRVRGNDPLYVWDSAAEHHVYIRKQDWVRASPAIRTIESCVILRMTPPTFRKRRDEMGVVPKRTTLRKFEDVPYHGPQTYYTINDLVEISKAFSDNKKNLSNFATEQEIRKLFSEGYVAYKRTKTGDFIPVWSESIY